MAASKTAAWTVVVVVEEKEIMTTNYKLSPDTKLSNVMETWKNEFEQFGHWIFVSADEETTFYDDTLTLEMVGETFPRIVTLRAVLLNKEKSCSTVDGEICVLTNDQCRHHVTVEPDDNLYEVINRITERPKCFECNGVPINLKNTVEQAGINHQAVIYESCLITVRLSTGNTRVFQLPSHYQIHQLKDEIRSYETGEFSLTHQGRSLDSATIIGTLKHVIEVKTADFVVHFHDKRVSWRTKSEPIGFTEFLSQLSVNGNIDTHTLESLEFVCIGCQRNICNSDDFIQQLPIECCKYKSMTLKVASLPNSKINANANDVVQCIERIRSDLLRCRENNWRVDTSRYRNIKAECDEKMLDYNAIITQSNETCLDFFNEVEDKINKLKTDIEMLKTHNVASEREIQQLKYANMKGNEKIEHLIEENKRFQKEKKKFEEHLRGLANENKKMNAESNKMYDMLSKKQKKMIDQEIGVKLLVLYDPDRFAPVPLPEVQEQGEYSWSYPFIKCRIPSVGPGHISAEVLRRVLAPFFVGEKIRMIIQCHGLVGEMSVVRVTNRDEDEAATPDQSPYCDADGSEYSWNEAGNPQLQVFVSGNVVICGGRRRTVLKIHC